MFMRKYIVFLMLLATTMSVVSCSNEDKSPTTPETSIGTMDIMDILNLTATGTCGGQSSPGNVYGCCHSGGNCIWWAWKQAKDNWGVNLPYWSYPKYWPTKAKEAGFPVSSTPKVNTIAVNTTSKCPDGGVCGHVAWVTKVNTDGTIQVSEMHCSHYGVYPNSRYKASWFNGGFIANKSTLPMPTVPEIKNVSPNPFPRALNWEKRILTVSGQNFQQGAKLEFKISGTSYVYPDRIPTFVSSSKLTYNISVGPNVYTWTVQVVNPDGRRSNLYTFYVK